MLAWHERKLTASEHPPNGRLCTARGGCDIDAR
jgi:hypothetical protein